MTHKELPPFLDPARVTAFIRGHPAFLAELPTQQNFAELPIEERQAYLQRAIASSALLLAGEQESHNSLDANLYTLVGELHSFYQSRRTIDSLNNEYGGAQHMPRDKKRVLHDNKKTITKFNHTLREVINDGASKFTFNDLLVFMTNMHIAGGGRDTATGFQENVRDVLIGMRNEMAFEQDALGGDVIINGVPIDVKASQSTVDIARKEAVRHGSNPHLIVWSHINFEDYEGQLTLPYERAATVLERVKPDIDQAVASNRRSAV